MSRTKQEVRDFLNSQVGQKVNAKAGIYNGQCVSLIKALLEFLGVPSPYAGRGNAINVNDTLLREGIAQSGSGWLTIVVNRDMGRIFENGVWNNYGHIWIDLQNEANFEQNGAKALYTTKNTRPAQQGQQFVNLDKYISGEDMTRPITKNELYYTYYNIYGQVTSDEQLSKDGLLGQDYAYVNEIVKDYANRNGIDYGTYKKNATSQIANLETQLSNIHKQNKELLDKIAKYEKNESEDKAAGDTFLRRIGQFFEKYWVAK